MTWPRREQFKRSAEESKNVSGERNSPAIYEQALALAEFEVLLSTVRRARTAVHERPLEILRPNRDGNEQSAGTFGPDKSDASQTAGSDVDVIRDALAEIALLDRYERRVLSRRKRAKRMLDQRFETKVRSSPERLAPPKPKSADRSSLNRRQRAECSRYNLE